MVSQYPAVIDDPSLLQPGRPRYPLAATRFLQRARLRESVARVAAADGMAGFSVEGVVADAGVSRKSFYEFYRCAEDALFDATEAVHAFALPRLIEAFDGQPTFANGVRAAIDEALLLTDRGPHWAALWVRSAHASPLRDLMDGACSVEPLQRRMRGRGASDVSVDAALDALEGLVRAACDGGDGPSLAASSAAIGDVVLGLLGEDDRTPMHPLPVEPSLTRRVDPAFEALMAGDDGAVARFDALIAAATLRGDGRALWRAFVCLHVVRRRATTIPAYDELLAAVLAGLGTARHFGLPVPEIAAGTADRRWTPPSDAVLILQYLGAHPGTTSRDVGLALGLDRDPRRLRRLLDELVSRGLITSTKSGRALAWNAADSSRFSP